MRIEGLGETSGRGLSDRAYEQLRAMRASIRESSQPQPAADPQTVPAPTVRPSPDAERPPLPTVADLDPRAAMLRNRPKPTLVRTLDADADGWINPNDLPFDYFQLVRRTTFRPSATPDGDAATPTDPFN